MRPERPTEQEQAYQRSLPNRESAPADCRQRIVARIKQGQEQDTAPKSPVQLDKGIENNRRNHRDKHSAKRAPGRNGKVIGRQMLSGRLQSIDLAVADHATEE